MKNTYNCIEKYISQKHLNNIAVRIGIKDEVISDIFKSTEQHIDTKTLFDMASITKIMATAMLCLIALDKGYIKLTLQADRLQDKEEGDLIEIYHSETGEHRIVNMKSKYKDMYAQFREMLNMIEGHPESGFTLLDAKEAFFAAVEADEDGSAFSCD